MSARTWASILVGLLEGTILGIGLLAAQAWYRGTSMDPRCVFGVRGYVDRHVIDDRRVMHVSCEYRPGDVP